MKAPGVSAVIFFAFSIAPDIRLSDGVRTTFAPKPSMIRALTWPYPSGITMTQRYPLTAASIASATPVLPDVGSTIVPPGPSSPRRSASSIIALAILSLTEPPGLNHSSLAKIRAVPEENRRSSTRGVLPINSSRARACWMAVADGALKLGLLLPDDSKKKPRRRRGLEETLEGV